MHLYFALFARTGRFGIKSPTSRMFCPFISLKSFRCHELRCHFQSGRRGGFWRILPVRCRKVQIVRKIERTLIFYMVRFI